MEGSVIWFRVDRRAFYEVPADARLPAGDVWVVSERGERRRVDTDAMARWEVPAEEARRRFTGEVDAAWARLVEGLSAAVNAAPPPAGPNPLTTLAERLKTGPVDPALERAGQKLRAALASPELAEALSNVGTKLQEVAQRLREEAAKAPGPEATATVGGAPSEAAHDAPSEVPEASSAWAATLGPAEFGLRYTSGHPASPSSPLGRCVVELGADGALRVSNQRGDELRAWRSTAPAAVGEVRRVLLAAGEPPVARPPLRPGASLVTVELLGSPGAAATFEYHAARKIPAWDAVLRLLDSLLLAGSGGALRVGAGHVDLRIEDLRAES